MPLNTVICGKGRLGQLIEAVLVENKINVSHARIDAQQGLIKNYQPITGTIDTLVLCFVPKHSEGLSGWQGLLQGLLSQVQNGNLKIQRVLFISSTAVYEEVAHGFVDEHTKMTGSSVRSKGLLDAEKIIPQLSSNSAVFRLTGLVGPGYQKYDPVTYSNEKPRQAVDTRAVAAEVARWFVKEQHGHITEVLTDGFIYWQGKQLSAESDLQEIEMLSKKYRLLKPSMVCR